MSSMTPSQQSRVDQISRASIALTPVKSSQISAIGSGRPQAPLLRTCTTSSSPRGNVHQGRRVLRLTY